MLQHLAVAGFIEATAASAPTWSAVLVAALGSSAVGAVVGGYLTTRMQGRHEREEAWRSRLIEAADELNKELVSALTTLGSVLPAASRGERPLRGEHGELTEETVECVDAISDVWRQIQARLGHLELLISSDEDAYQHARRSMELVLRSEGLVRGRSTAQLLVNAVLAERESPDSGVSLLSEQDEGRGLPLLFILRTRGDLPDGFDPLDDANVARWARELHHAAGDQAHQYTQAARLYIESYTL